MAVAKMKLSVGGLVVGLLLLLSANVYLFAGRPPASDASLDSMAHAVDVAEARLEELTKTLKDIEEALKQRRASSREHLQLLQERMELLKSLENLKAEQKDNGGDSENGQKEPEKKESPKTTTKETAPAITTPTIPVLVLACNRATVKRALDELIRYRPSASQFPIVVSQDCAHEPTAQVVREYADRGVTLVQQPDQSEPHVPPQEYGLIGYYKIARHYKFALGYIFGALKAVATIIVEDDLDISPDFFEYFTATYSLLEQDPTLWCVSAWNDNGKTSQVADNKRLYRSDFFGGLGWMLTARVWQEPKWAVSYWDDWMRLPAQRRERACIRPEVSRTRTFGRVGVSNGQFYDEHLKFIRLNEEPVNFTKMDLSYLLKSNYDTKYLDEVYSTQMLTSIELRDTRPSSGTYHVEYSDNAQFERIARDLGIMSDLKSGVPRTAYLGIVSVISNGNRVFIAPTRPWRGYVE